MKILGIDPGTARLGYAVIESYPNNNLYELFSVALLKLLNISLSHHV